MATMPLPPRRPANLAASSAPLPPVRPTELALLSGDAGAKTAGEETHAADALASLIDAPAGRSVGNIGPKDLPTNAFGSASSEAAPAAAKPVLAYAATAAEPGPGTRASDVSTGLRAFASMKSGPSKAAIRAPLVPARLDRSNFGAMTGAAPTDRVTVGSMLGSAICAPRSAARAESGILAAAPSSRLSAFSGEASAPPSNKFDRAHR
jgi:hypothetical protein